MRKINYDGIIIPHPESYIDCIVLAKSDFYRYYGKEASIAKMLLYSIISPFFSFNFYLRLSSYKSSRWWGGIYLIFKLIKTFIGRKRCLMISEDMPIGYGLYLAHAFGVIVNPKAIIGNNCTISQFVTIGSMKGNAAKICNNCYIGPSVCIVEDVKINNDSVIGAGAVVVKDVPEAKTVAGVPAKVISNNNSKNLIQNPWMIK